MWGKSLVFFKPKVPTNYNFTLFSCSFLSYVSVTYQSTNFFLKPMEVVFNFFREYSLILFFNFFDKFICCVQYFLFVNQQITPNFFLKCFSFNYLCEGGCMFTYFFFYLFPAIYQHIYFVLNSF